MRTTYLKMYEDALRYNLRTIRELVPKGVETIAVVKANAYGFGALRVARMALEEGYTAMAVAVTSEAAQLREHGISCPIYILGLLLPPEFEEALRADAIIPVCESTELELLEAEAAAMGKMARVMIAVDSGMNRIGVQAEDAPAFLKFLEQYRHLNVHGFFTHFACADADDHAHVKCQKEAFAQMVKKIPDSEKYVFTAANSSATLYFPETYYSAVRPGQIIYGYKQSGRPDTVEQLFKQPKLESTLGLYSRLVHVHRVRAGGSVGYGATYTAKEDTWIGTIPIGYADGYPRSLSNCGVVLVGGRRCKIAGRVCMDQIMVDLGPELDFKADQEVVLIGRQGGEEITIEEFAALAGTIPNEISCRLSARIPHIYCNKSEE